MKYAENTSVPVERSKAEIDRMLARYGATEFMTGWDQSRAVVGFKMAARLVRFLLPLPSRTDAQFTTTTDRWNRVKVRAPEAAHASWEQACRQRWRALALVIKAKLEAVETGITTFEDEFMAHIVLPDGRTVGEHIRPKIEAAYTDPSRPMPGLLPDYSRGAGHVD